MLKNKFPAAAVSAVLLLSILGCNFNTETDAPAASNDNRASAPKSPEKETKNDADSAETPVHSTDLIEAFRKDKDAANAKYKDKVILISGKITNINDVFGVKALNLRDSENEMGLQTYLKDKKDVEKVKVGDTVVVRGKVRGDGVDVVDNAEIIKVN
jgi:hypothetical protein